ncbi:MAG TPA: MMPL family transporter [Polyangia bacterium]|jgi:hypothetical protein
MISERDLARRFADLITRWHRVVLLGTAVLIALAGWRASKLTLRPNLAELLPQNDPAVVALRDLDRRVTGLSTVVVVVQSPNPAANRRFIDDLMPRLEAVRASIPVIDDVQAGVHQEESFYRRNKFLYAGLDDLQEAYARLHREILKRKNPAFVDLTGRGDSLEDERRQIDRKERELLGRFPGGYFATKDQHLYAVVIWLKTSLFGEGPGAAAAARISDLAGALGPARYDPRMTIGLTGSVVTAAEERQGLENDLVLATSICVTLVCLVIFLYYGRLRAVPFAAIPAFGGVTFALCFAQIAFGYLNSSTAFLGSIIVGNGINYAIVQMARYEEERRRGRDVRDAVATALAGTWRATAVAALGAAVAYGSLAVTSFRGFNQFGYIGFVGMVLAWVLTIIVLPALWVTFDRHRRGFVPRVRGFALAAPVARLAVRRPGALLIAGGAVTLIALIALPRYLRDPFEYNFENLRNQRSRTSETERLSARLDPIFGRTLSPNFILADRRDQVEPIRRALWERNKPRHVLGDVKTIDDYLPGPPAEQQQKLAVLARIRALLDQNMRLLDDKERADAANLRPPDDLRVVGIADLPATVRRYYTEADGTVGRIVIYYPRKDISVWDGKVLLRLADVVQSIRLPGGETVRSSGSAVVFAAMLRAIVHDGPLVTLAAFIGVASLVLLLTYRRGGWWLILGVLLTGVLWMVGGAAITGVRINFLNFIALPITFGIGVDYGVNLALRYREEGPGRVFITVAATGGAVTLASMTTIIGYAALLVADNHALRSFGAFAILGEFACLTAAIVILPAVLIFLERHRGSRAAVGGAVSPPVSQR